MFIENDSFSLGLLKPDCTLRHLTKTIMEMILETGLEIVATKTLFLSASDVEAFYVSCITENFFAEMSLFLQSGPTIAYLVRGNEAITRLNKLVGSTDPVDALPGTIRRMGTDIRHNLAHSSQDSLNFLREATIIFNRDELETVGII